MRLLPLLAVTFLATPAAAQGPPAKVVPFTLLPSRHMLIEATVNGQGPYKFIFDTGAPINLVSGAVAKAAGLSNNPLAAGLGMLLSGPTQAKLKTLTVGGVTAEKVPVVVMDHPTVAAISDAFKKDHGPIHGIIGFPFFARFATTIDYQRKELSLAPTDYKPGDYLEDVFDRLTAAAENGGKPKVVAPAGLWGFAVEKAADAGPGVVVKSVTAGGPAAKAGLRAGDRVLTIDGRWTDTPADALTAVSLAKPGRTVPVAVSRGGTERTLEVTPANGL